MRPKYNSSIEKGAWSVRTFYRISLFVPILRMLKVFLNFIHELNLTSIKGQTECQDGTLEPGRG